MPDRRAAQLEDRFKQTPQGLRKRAGAKIAGLPLYDIAIGPDPARNEIRGYARGLIAIGDDAAGVVAIGWVARGGLAIGGCAIGIVAFGALSLGAVLAAGGLALGTVAFGGAAVGGAAIGFEAAGYYACGSNARGAHVIEDDRRDPEAIVFFAERGLGRACGQDDIRGKSL
jgi:hypothetical protein